MKTCHHCGGKLEKSVELVIHNGKSFPQQVQKCIKCGKAVVSIDEYEKVRKQIHPSFFERIKNIFSSKTETVDIFKGKIL